MHQALHLIARRVREDRGFSLMELLVVVLVMFILTGAGLVKLIGPQDTARERDAIEKLHAAHKYAQAAAIDNDGPFPPGTELAGYIDRGMRLPAEKRVQRKSSVEEITQTDVITMLGDPAGQSLTLAIKAYTGQMCLLAVVAGELTGPPGCGENAPPAEPPTPVVVHAPPVMLTAPSVTGDPRVGAELTADPGDWDGLPAFTYQWRRCTIDTGSCSDISGATEATYTPVSADTGSQIQIRVKASNSDGEETAVSGPSATVEAKPADVSYVSSSVSGTSYATPGYAPVTLTKPAGVQAGDTMIFLLNMINSPVGAGPWSTGAGVNTVAGMVNTGGHPKFAVLSKTATASEPASYTFSFPGTTTSHLAVGGVFVYRNTSGPANVRTAEHAYNSANGYTSSYTIPAVPDAPGGLRVAAQLGAICIFSCDQVTPSGFTHRARGWVGAANGSAPVRGFVSVSDQAPPFSGAVNWSGNGGDTAVASFALPPQAPATVTARPTISGTPRETRTLTATPGTWTGADTVQFQWQRCGDDGDGCVNIAGATNATYEVTSADVASRLRVQATGVKGSLRTSAVSAMTDPATAVGSVTFVSASSFKTTAVTGNVTWTTPAGAQPGDVLVATATATTQTNANGYQWTLPNGWKQQAVLMSGADARTVIATRTVQAGDPSSYQAVYGTSQAGVMGNVVAYRGADEEGISVTQTQTNVSTGATYTWASQASSTKARWLSIYRVSGYPTSTTTFAGPPSPFVLRSQDNVTVAVPGVTATIMLAAADTGAPWGSPPTYTGASVQNFQASVKLPPK